MIVDDFREANNSPMNQNVAPLIPGLFYKVWSRMEVGKQIFRYPIIDMEFQIFDMLISKRIMREYRKRIERWGRRKLCSMKYNNKLSGIIISKEYSYSNWSERSTVRKMNNDNWKVPRESENLDPLLQRWCGWFLKRSTSPSFELPNKNWWTIFVHLHLLHWYSWAHLIV